jgi:D-apionolactonase
MISSAPRLLYYGKDAPLPTALLLRAGLLTLCYEESSLRYIRLGKHEIISHIYCAVRDHNWGTIPAHLTIEEMSVRDDSFNIRYVAEHHQADIHFVWTGTLSGTSEGKITFGMDGQALSTFRRNRIGFCVLHPMICTGAACVIEHADGSITKSIFPADIMPHQPFQQIQTITHTVTGELQASVHFDGETFEMEDQRNWTDASYKTYCTPLDLPFPVEITAGTRIQQSVTLHLIGTPIDVVETGEQSRTQPIQFVIGSEITGHLPRLGLGTASHGQALTPLELQRLRALKLAHLRADIRFEQSTWEQDLRQRIIEARAIGAALEVALHLTDRAASELVALQRLLDMEQPTVAAWLLFRQGMITTPPNLTELARQHLASHSLTALFAGGTDAFFTQLNRNRPDMTGLDLLTYSLNPQVHAFDNVSLVETLPVQAVTLASARTFSAGNPVMVSPITLKMRFNPAATRPDDPTLPNVLPSQVDVRQMSLFGAGWTLGSIKHMALGGAYSVTYYETTGWRGVMETADGSPLPELFASTAGAVFPLYHVLADIGEWADATVLRSESSDPLSVEGIALRGEARMRVLLANFTQEKQPVRVSGIHGETCLRMLDEHTAAEALTEPDWYRSRVGTRLQADGELNVELAPYAVARIDIMAQGT